MNFKRFNGLNKNTATKIVLDVGAVFVGFDLAKSYAENKAAGKCVGALQGGCSFTVTPVTHTIKVDGMPENTKGFRETDSWTGSVAAKMLEQDAQNLQYALGMADVEEATLAGVQYQKITPRDSIQDDDYLDNVTIAGRIRGSVFPVYVVIKNALSTGGLGWNFGPQAESVSDVTFDANYDIGEDDELSPVPFALYIPVDVAPEAVAAALEDSHA